MAAGAAAFVSKSQPLREVMDVARSIMGVARGEELQKDWRPLPIGASNTNRPKLSLGESEALKLYVADPMKEAVTQAQSSISALGNRPEPFQIEGYCFAGRDPGASMVALRRAIDLDRGKSAAV